MASRAERAEPPRRGAGALRHPRLALGVEYDGGAFHGFQAQARGPTIQQTLEQALGHVAAGAVRVVGSGRTDAGVHATGQVVHFDPPVARPLRSWLLGANTALPEALVIRWIRPVPEDFHARFSAEARRYRYRVVNRPVRPAVDRLVCAWERAPLDAARMHAAAQALVGEHDFSSFRAAACQARHAVRRLHRLAVRRRAERIDIVIVGNAFLHHMVRNIVGALAAVGRGERPVSWPGELLAARDRRLGAPTAHARGLTLEAVRYPARFGLPGSTTAPRDVGAVLPHPGGGV